MQPVREWLGSLGLSEYADSFDRNRIDLSVLPDLTDQDLKELGLVLGDRGSATWQFGHRGSRRGRRHRPELVRSRPRLCIRRLAAQWSMVPGSVSLTEIT